MTRSSERQKLIRGLIDLAEQQNWTVIRGGRSNHWKATSPAGRMVVFPATPTDHRSYLNTIADFRRNGLEVPRANQRKKKPGERG